MQLSKFIFLYNEIGNLEEDIKDAVGKCPVKMFFEICGAWKIKSKDNDPAAKPPCDRKMSETFAH